MSAVEPEGGLEAVVAGVLVQRRRCLGLTLREVAEQSGISFNTLSRIERGRNFTVAHLAHLQRWLAAHPATCCTPAAIAQAVAGLATAEAAGGDAGLREAVGVQVGYLELTAKQIREQGDVAQVLLSDDGVGQAPSLADELWVIAYNIRAALAPAATEADQ